MTFHAQGNTKKVGKVRKEHIRKSSLVIKKKRKKIQGMKGDFMMLARHTTEVNHCSLRAARSYRQNLGYALGLQVGD